MGRIILHQPLPELDLPSYGIRLVREVPDAIREITMYVYAGEDLPVWELGKYPVQFQTWTDYLRWRQDHLYV